MTTLLRRSRAALVALLALVGLLTVAPAAHAHDMLIGSEPAEGAVLEESPSAVVLTFNNTPLDVGSAITVVDAQGAPLAEGEGTVDGTDVVLELDTALPAGELEVQWRVASSDGHPIEGVIPFTVEAPTEPQTTAAEEPAAATEPGTTEPVTTADAAPATTDPTDDVATGGLAGLPTALKVAIGVAVLGAVVGLVVLVARRLREDRV